MSVPVAGLGGVPASGATAVALNVTVTEPTADGYLTLSPTGHPRPLAANLNFTPNKTVPNLVVVALGTGGQVDLFNSAGASHVVFDVAGWFSADASGNAGRFAPVVPARILDTRTGTGGSSVRLGPGASLDVMVAGQNGVPVMGVGAVVMNVAVTNATAQSYLTVHPTSEPRPLAANLNWLAGETVSNRVIAKLGSFGRVTVYNPVGEVDIVVDVNGWFSDATLAPPGLFTPGRDHGSVLFAATTCSGDAMRETAATAGRSRAAGTGGFGRLLPHGAGAQTAPCPADALDPAVLICGRRLLLQRRHGRLPRLSGRS